MEVYLGVAGRRRHLRRKNAEAERVGRRQVKYSVGSVWSGKQAVSRRGRHRRVRPDKGQSPTLFVCSARGIAATTLLTLALCIGATTAIFSTVYSLMLKPLPFSEPEGIVELYTSATKAGLNKMPANIPFYIDYGKNATSTRRSAFGHSPSRCSGRTPRWSGWRWRA